MNDLQNSAIFQPAPEPLTPKPDSAFGRSRDFFGNRFVYAVISQRARGLSIGVNLTPNRVCNFDCVYCEVNRDQPTRDHEIDVRVMSAELQDFLRRAYDNKMRELKGFQELPQELLQLKEVALSGDGEPTLSPAFFNVVVEVTHLRIRKFPFFKIVLLTNATGLHLPLVKAGLRNLTPRDEIWVKLDAGTQSHMSGVNQTSVSLKRVLDNILTLGLERPIVIQSLFPLLDGEEIPPEEVANYVQRLQELKAAGAQITLVQIYSAHRPPHRPSCGHLRLRSLSEIARQVRKATGLKAEVF